MTNTSMEIQNIFTKTSPYFSISIAARYACKSTIENILSCVALNYYTPSDVWFRVEGFCEMGKDLEVNLIFKPFEKRRKKTKQKPYLTFIKKYKTDVQMTEELYSDIMTMLSEHGLIALYNKTGKDIKYRPKSTNKFSDSLKTSKTLNGSQIPIAPSNVHINPNSIRITGNFGVTEINENGITYLGPLS